MKVLLVGRYPDFAVREMRKRSELVCISASDRRRLGREIRHAEMLIVNTLTKVDHKLLEKAGSLKAVITFSHGFEHVDVEGLRSRDIRFHTVPGTTDSVAELTFGLIISVLRKIPYHDRHVKSGKWNRGERDFGHELRGKTLGVIGLGPIGREVCRMSKAFGMRAVACDPNRMMRGSLKVRMVSLGRLLEISDVVSLHAHLNDKTRHMLGPEEFRKMKQSAILINTARGGLVDSDSLYKALKSGRIAGAGLDVFEKEPPGRERLLGLPNVVATPHVGAYTHEGEDKKGRMLLSVFAREVKRF